MKKNKMVLVACVVTFIGLCSFKLQKSDSDALSTKLENVKTTVVAEGQQSEKGLAQIGTSKNITILLFALAFSTPAYGQLKEAPTPQDLDLSKSILMHDLDMH